MHPIEFGRYVQNGTKIGAKMHLVSKYRITENVYNLSVLRTKKVREEKIWIIQWHWFKLNAIQAFPHFKWILMSSILPNFRNSKVIIEKWNLYWAWYLSMWKNAINNFELKSCYLLHINKQQANKQYR